MRFISEAAAVSAPFLTFETPNSLEPRPSMNEPIPSSTAFDFFSSFVDVAGLGDEGFWDLLNSVVTESSLDFFSSFVDVAGLGDEGFWDLLDSVVTASDITGSTLLGMVK